MCGATQLDELFHGLTTHQQELVHQPSIHTNLHILAEHHNDRLLKYSRILAQGSKTYFKSDSGMHLRYIKIG